MKITSLLEDFSLYLEKINNNSENKYVSDSSSVSIFAHFSEFKKFLSQELKIDDNIFTKSYNDIMSLEVVDGKLVSKKLYTNNADKPSLTEEFSNGKRIRTTYVDGKIEARNVFGPNNEPLELMKKTVFHTGEKVYVNYRFKEDGTRLCEDFYRIDDTQKPFLTIRYSENGKKITQATKREDDGRYSVTEYTSWEYPAEKTYYNDENLTSISEKITYNKKGGEIEHIYYDSEGNIVPYKNIFADTQK